jgi:hypothetical protein
MVRKVGRGMRGFVPSLHMLTCVSDKKKTPFFADGRGLWYTDR